MPPLQLTQFLRSPFTVAPTALANRESTLAYFEKGSTISLSLDDLEIFPAGEFTEPQFPFDGVANSFGLHALVGLRP